MLFSSDYYTPNHPTPCPACKVCYHTANAIAKDTMTDIPTTPQETTDTPSQTAQASATPARKRTLDIAVAGVLVAVFVLIFVLAEVTSPRRIGLSVAYLSPAYGGVQNVWIAPINAPQEARQITFTDYGVYDFGVSADGRLIVYAQRQEPSGLHELMLYNLETRTTTQLTQCVQEEADCRTPRFRPSGEVLAYERVNTNASLNRSGVNVGLGAIRIWLLDLNDRTYFTRPLAEDTQFVGHSPEWSVDGNTLVFYASDIANPGIMIYNFSPREGDKTLKFIPSQYGTAGALSPNAQQIVFPDLTRRDDGNIYTYLRLADLDALTFGNLTEPDEPVDDTMAKYHPNGAQLLIERRYTDTRYTRGYQLYMMDIATRETEPLLIDERYTHGFFAFNAAGDWLVMQRFPLGGQADTSPQIWAYHLPTQRLTLVTDNAFHPRWLIGE